MYLSIMEFLLYFWVVILFAVTDSFSRETSTIPPAFVPFKKAFKIKLKDKVVGTFSRAQVRVNIKEKNCLLIFGTNFDFN